MLRIRTGARHGLRWGVFGFVAAVLTISSDRTEAAPYSDIVVDANSGSVLHSTNPDSRRHPASLTKIMTLYLLFEQLEAGKLKLDSELAVSREAAGQDPTKLGLKPGGSLKVEDAIKGIVTRSANDAAVVVAEAIAGDEDSFAKLMTRKAQALGMSHTVYRNASGLPDDEQVTTARDQATLGRAIQERFPRYYKYFSTRSFTFRGDSIANHNRLLGRVDGVDGIKTGYISASGFNLVTSVHRGNRYLVAVVMGGSSAGSRDARMRELISDKIAQASTKRTAPMFAEAGETPEIEPKVARAEGKPERKVAAAASERKAEGKPEPKPDSKSETRFAVASASSVPVRFTPGFARAATGSTEPIKPVLVKTITVRAGTQTASLAPLQAASPPAAEPVQPTAPVVQVAAAMPTAPAKPQLPPAPAAAAKSEAAAPTPPATAKVEPPAPAPATTAKPQPPVPAPAASVKPEPPAPAPTVKFEPPAPTPTAAAAKPQVHSGWMIQVGAYQAEQEAKQRLAAIQAKAAKVLSGADAFTETVEKGGATYWRARFAGLDKDKAEAACKYLKRNDVDCVTIKN